MPPEPPTVPTPSSIVIELFRGTVAWRIGLSIATNVNPSSGESAPQCFLHPAELAEFNTYSFDRRRQTYLLGRAAAKRAITCIAPPPAPPVTAIEIRPGVFDQPIVVGPLAAPLGVSITHTDGTAAATAFPLEHPVGIDLEAPSAQRASTIHATLTPRESTLVRQFDADPLILLTAIWTAREALSKILVCGLTAPFHVLGLDSLTALSPNAWQATFANFSQYKAHVWHVANHILCLVLPKNSSFTTPLQPNILESLFDDHPPIRLT